MDKKEYISDKVIEAILQSTVSDIEDKMVDNLLEGFEGTSHVFSKKHREDINKLIKKERKSLLKRRIQIYSKRAAVIFSAVIIISIIAIGSVSAWRIRFMNFIVEMTQYDTDINFTDNDTKTGTYKFNEITLEYIPEGFKLEKNEVSENHIYLVFTKEEEYFNFRTMDIEGSVSIDTEDSYVKELMINGRKTIYSENDNVRILVWNDDDTAYILTGSIRESEFVKIVENIKK